MLELYKLLLVEREHDSQRFWVIFGAMSVANAAIFGLVAKDSPPVLTIVASSLGCVLCIVWAQAQRRIGKWVQWWETRLQELEAGYFSELNHGLPTGVPPLPVSFKVFVNRSLLNEVGLSTKTAASVVAATFAFGWLALALVSFARIFGQNCQQAFVLLLASATSVA